QQALADLPEGELDTFLADPTLTLMLLNGSMYPDGGYGPVDHPNAHEAAESSHWEPYQNAYREWIMATYSQPWSAEAKEHIAFYLGMSAHGMGDQVFDSMFMQRSVAFDASPLDDFDQFMDYILVDRTGESDVPDHWVPDEQLLTIYESIGLAYTTQAILDGQAILRAAISLINAAAAVPDNITNAEALYPWASSNLLEVSAEGSPPVEAAVIRRYWQVNWDLLHDRGLRRPVLYTFPYDGTANHPTDSTNIESWITIVFARGLDASVIGNDFFLVEDADGVPVPTNYQLFYGNESHVVHLKPVEDLAEDTVYTVTIDPGLVTVHDETLEGWSFRFSTGAVAPDPIHDDEDWDNPDPPAPPDPPDPP
ncbi:MAG: Ig-like domain-containing protein, partial [Nannocystaceae bacterium]